MQVNRYHILILLMVLCGSCIEPFNPQIEESQEVLVINGIITDRSGLHHVVISRSTPYNDPSFAPVTGCVVTVQDEKGQVVGYSETSPGVYEAYLESGFLQVGKSYALFASTPEGNEYRSDYDSLLACPPVDNIYYELKSHETTDPDITLHGAQFYMDVKGTSETASNYRWLLEETWEYTAPYVADLVWFGGEVLPNLSDSMYTCYMTNPVKDLFSASTRYLSVNHLYRNPLHYVSNESPRLRIKYSVLVEQHSLTNQAFDYWDHLKSQSGEGGGLYESQPSSTIGNIYNVNDPSEKVLGYFYATQVQQERLALEAISEFELPRYQCVLDTIQSLNELDTSYPHFLFSLSPMGSGPPYLHGRIQCFDCRLYGGTTTPPEFW
jgi:hypothetical protein